MSSPRHIRELVEAALDEISWIWSQRLSLMVDELLVREERDDDA